MSTIQSTSLPRAKYLALVTLLSIPGVTWLCTVGDVAEYWRYTIPSGQTLYLFSKLAGLYAFIVFWLQIMYGILGKRGRQHLNVELGIAFHRKLGFLVVTLVLTHLGLFVLAASLRIHTFASQYLTPSFSSGYYRGMITLGMLAAILVAVGVTAATLRQKLTRSWKYVHWAIIPAYILGFIHSLYIGSESRIAPMAYLYAAMAATFAITAVWRIRSSLR